MKITKLGAAVQGTIAVLPMALGAVTGTVSGMTQDITKANADIVTTPESQHVDGSDYLGLPAGSSYWVMYASNGGWQYCLDYDLAPQTDTGKPYVNGAPAGFDKTTWKQVQNIIMHGSTGRGQVGDIAKKFGANGDEAGIAAQTALWIFLGRKGIGNNSLNTHIHGSAKTINEMYQGMPADHKKLVDALIASADIDANTAPTQAGIDAAKDKAKAAAESNVASKLASMRPSVQASLSAANKAALDQTRESQDAKLDVIAKSQLANAITITPVSTAMLATDKKALPNWNDANEKEGHVDNVTNGTHDFHINIGHKNLTSYSDANGKITYNLPSSVAVQLNSILPSGAVLKSAGSVVHPKTSDGKTYVLGYGNYTVSIPFSDQPAPGANTASAVASLMMSDAKFPAGKISDAFRTTAKWTTEGATSSRTSSTVISAADTQSYYLSGGISGVGYSTDPINPNEQRYGLVVQTSVADVKGSVSASSQLPISAIATNYIANEVSSDVHYSDGISWEKKLGSLVVQKINEDGKPLKGVTFQLVQDGVKNSDVAEYKKSNPLATEDGQNISLPKVTNSAGQVTFANLPFGTYELLEIQTNEGYKLAPDPVKIVIDGHHVDKQFVDFKNAKNATPEIKVSSEAPKPEIHTVATSKDKHTMIGAGQQPLQDTVKYSNLKVGETYSITGEIMNKETGKTTGIKKTVKFTAKESTGSIEVDFGKIDAGKYAGDKIVAFESISDSKGSEVASHEDINDKGQSVDVTKPKIHTTATVDGKKTVNPDGTYKIIDKVDYEGLMPGQTYELSGVAIDKVTAKPVEKSETGKITFKADNDGSGSVEVPLKVDMTKAGEKGVVMFEKAKDTEDNQIIATHEDINDAGQSITLNKPQVGAVKKELGPTSAQKIANDNLVEIATVLISMSLVIAGGVGYSKNKKAMNK